MLLIPSALMIMSTTSHPHSRGQLPAFDPDIFSLMRLLQEVLRDVMTRHKWEQDGKNFLLIFSTKNVFNRTQRKLFNYRPGSHSSQSQTRVRTSLNFFKPGAFSGTWSQAQSCLENLFSQLVLSYPARFSKKLASCSPCLGLASCP